MSFLPANDPIYAAIRNTAAKFSTRKEIKMPATEMPKTAQKSSSANAQSAAAKPTPKQAAKKAVKAAAKEEHKDSSRAKRAAYAEGSLASPADIAAKLGMTPKAVRAKLRKIEATLPKGLLISTEAARWGFTDLNAICKLISE